MRVNNFLKNIKITTVISSCQKQCREDASLVNGSFWKKEERCPLRKFCLKQSRIQTTTTASKVL